MAISGMTGFARHEGVAGELAFVIEARSVNGRQLEARLRAPPGLEGLDRPLRELAAARFSRGQISLSLRLETTAASGGEVDEARLQRLLDLARRHAGREGVAPPRLDGLMALASRPYSKDLDPLADAAARGALGEALGEGLAAALDGLLSARDEEGRALQALLFGILDEIEAAGAAAEREAARQPAAIKERFERRIAELAPGAGLEDKIVAEAALHAARADVREEIDRLRIHLAAARNLIAAGGPCGRKLDFLTQEFMREANTLCSKSALPGLTRQGLELKALIDQLREQVQNVE